MSLKLFYLTTEISPFANIEKVGDFSAAVPLALQNLGHDIRTMLPKYGYVSERKYILREVIRLREIPFEFGSEDIVSSAKSAFIPKTRVQVYFLEDKHWFKPLNNLIYKSKNGRQLGDNDIRFAFFSKAAIAILPHLFWKPDIMLCNNWTSVFVPAVYKELYESKEFYGNIKTVLLVHSLDENENFSSEAFKKAGLKIPENMNGDSMNGYEAAAPYADLIICLDTPANKLSEKLLKYPGIIPYKDKVVTISLSDDTSPDYPAVANSINDELVKLYD